MTLYAWVPCDDGFIRKINQSEIVDKIYTGCSNTWIACANKLICMPGITGEIICMNGLGLIRDSIVLKWGISHAIGINNNIVAFDSRGNGAIISVSINGKLNLIDSFKCIGITDIQNITTQNNIIYLACRNKDLYSVDITTTYSVVCTKIASYSSEILMWVLSNNSVATINRNTIANRLYSGAVVNGVNHFIGNGGIYTSLNSFTDARITLDGVLMYIGYESLTQCIKTSPSRKTVSWIKDGRITSEVYIGAGCNNVVLSPSVGVSNEFPLTDYGGGGYQPGNGDGTPAIPTLPTPVYSTVTFTVAGVPNVISSHGGPSVGHGSEMNGTYTVDVIYDGVYPEAYSFGATISDSPPYIAVGVVNLPNGQEGGFTATCGSGSTTAAYVRGHMNFLDGQANNWFTYSNTHIYAGFIGQIPIDAVYNVAWPPETCPGQFGTITIISWNR